jgi:cellulose synthase/poly-beta-1,6-N-acetylglucosamine synthase-like glycosyltransferase
LGISSALIGSGMGLDYRLFKKTMATVDSVGEDKEVELKIIKQGYRIEYAHDALIFDEKTQRSDAFVNQRRRWIAAQLNYFKTHFADGIKELFLRGNFDYFDKVIQMVQPPRILLSGILFVIIVLLSLIEFLPVQVLQPYIAPGYYVWFALFAAAAIAIGISVPRKFYTRKAFRALLSLPYGFILMLISLFKFRGAMQKFLHTEHSHVQDKTNDKSSS